VGDLKAAKRDRLQARILTERVRGVFDDLLGKGALSPPRDWGRSLVTFPEPGAWDVPTRLWHWDNPSDLHLDQPKALFVVSFIGSVGPRGGGTLILSGSPRLLIQQERRIPADERRGLGAGVWERFHRCHPWLMALTGQAPSPADRVAAFMDEETIVDGVPLRVVELTGEPGTWSSAIQSWSTASRRTGASGRASCGSSHRFSPTRVVSCCAPRD
jgi:hypothetical protein